MKRHSVSKSRSIYLVIIAVISLILLFSSSCKREEDQPQDRVDDWHATQESFHEKRGCASSVRRAIQRPTDDFTAFQRQQAALNDLLASSNTKDMRISHLD